MEKNDLIQREAIVYEAGKRAISVSLTEKGSAIEEEVTRIFDEVEEISFKGFTAEEKETFIGLLERIHRNINEK
jgi:DNA-binding MarR family transcriptional regulator